MISTTKAHTGNSGWLHELWAKGWLKGLLLVAAVVFAYQPVWQAGFIWDDDEYVTNNSLLTAPDGLRLIWFSLDSPSQYFPLVYTVFRMEHAVWGLNPAGYHWVNILLHAANALLVWQLLKRLSVPGAWLAAAIFALHPVQVESVAWITELKNVLSLFFFLLTLLMWIKFIEDQARPSWRFYGLGLIFYALALFSKSTACTLPAALLLILWLKHRPINLARWLQITSFIMMGLGMGLLAMWWERYHQGTQGKLFSISLLERILVASHAVWFYAGKLVWPANLTFSYPRWIINPANPLAYGWVAGCGIVAAASYFARRGSGRSIEVAALYYVATLSPMLGFIMLYTFRYSFVADHYQYVAMIGPTALVTAGISMALDRFGERSPYPKLVLCGVLLLVLGVLTWRQCGMYNDLETLWRTTIARNPRSFMAYDNLGIAFLQKGRRDEALVLLRKAVEIQSNPETCNNLGLALIQQGEVGEAITNFSKAVEYEPDYVDAQDSLGLALLRMGRVDEAIVHMQKAVAIRPDNAEAQNNLGSALLQKGRWDEASAYFQKSLKLQPDFGDAYCNLGFISLRNGHLDMAIEYFQEGLNFQPNNVAALKYLSWILATCPDASLRNGTQAVELAQQANQLSGTNNPAILATLAAAQAEVGYFPDAMTTAQKALALATAQTNVAVVNALRNQIGFYAKNLPFRDNSLTNRSAGTQ